MAKAQKIEDETRSKAPSSSSTYEEVDDTTTDQALLAIELRRENLKLQNRKLLLELRGMLAKWALVLVVFQILVANFFFWYYLNHNVMGPEPAIMVAWVSGTVVEVIGILWVIARSLFPYRDKGQSGPEKLPKNVQA